MACKPLACLTPFQPAPRPSALTGSTGTSSTTAPFAGGLFPAGSTSVNSTLTFVGTCDGLPLTNCPWYRRSPCCTRSWPSPWAWSLRHSPYTSERSNAKQMLEALASTQRLVCRQPIPKSRGPVECAWSHYMSDGSLHKLKPEGTGCFCQKIHMGCARLHSQCSAFGHQDHAVVLFCPPCFPLWPPHA